jgi:hypothetical protein
VAHDITDRNPDHPKEVVKMRNLTCNIQNPQSLILIASTPSSLIRLVVDYHAYWLAFGRSRFLCL